MSNFTNNRWFSALMLLFLTANIVTLAILWLHHKETKGQPDGPPQANGEVFEFVTRELKLDSAQQSTYRQLREEHQAAVRPLQDSLRNARDRFFALLQSATPADSMVQSYSRNIADIEQSLSLVTFRHFQKLRTICRPEQQTKFDSIIQDVLRQLGGPRRPGGPPPPPRRGGPDGMPPPPDGREGPDGPRH